MSAYGVVLADISTDRAGDIAAIRSMARRWNLDLEDVQVVPHRALGALVARLSTSLDVVVAPSEPHVHDFMAVLRRSVSVWTADPPMCWPQGGGRPQPITRPDRHLRGA